MSIIENALNRAKPLLSFLILNVPVLGWMLRDVKAGRESALGFFGLNITMLWLIAGFTFGIPGMLFGAYIMLACAALWLLTIMRI